MTPKDIKRIKAEAGLVDDPATDATIERFAKLIEHYVERDISDLLLIAHMKGFEEGKTLTRERLAKAIEAMPFGKDTVQSFAVFIRSYR